MSRRLLALLVALSSALLLALTVPATGQVRTIKPWISAAGVDLSGLTVEQAAALLDQAYAPRLQGDMILGAAGVPWSSDYGRGAAQARLGPDGEARPVREGRV